MRIFIIDSNADSVNALRRRLITLPKIEAIGANYEYETANYTIGVWRDEPKIAPFPDIVILDARIDGGSVPDLIRTIKKIDSRSRARILIYADQGDDEACRGCLAAGAEKIFHKGGPQNGLEDLVSFVLKSGR